MQIVGTNRPFESDLAYFFSISPPAAMELLTLWVPTSYSSNPKNAVNLVQFCKSQLPFKFTFVSYVVIPSSTAICNIDILIDVNFSKPVQVDLSVSRCFHTLQNIRLVWQYFTIPVIQSMVTSLVISRMDNCSGLISLPAVQLWRRQSKQNAAARLISNLCCYDNFIDASISVYWLFLPSVFYLQTDAAIILRHSQHCISTPINIYQSHHPISPFWSQFRFLFSSFSLPFLIYQCSFLFSSLQVFHYWCPVVPDSWCYCDYNNRLPTNVKTSDANKNRINITLRMLSDGTILTLTSQFRMNLLAR